jgi:putative ABC transport system permease protein
MAVWTVRASALHSIDETINTWNHNLHLTLNRPYRTDQLMYEARKIPGVVGVENWLVKTGLRKRADGSEGGNLTVTGLPAATDMFHPLIRQGRWLVPGDTNAIVVDSGILKDERDLTIGSDLVLKIEGRELSFRVVGIIMGQMQGAVAYVDYPAFARAVRDVGRGNRVVIATAQRDVGFEKQMAQTLEQRFKSDGLRVSVTETREDLRALTTTHYNVVVVLLLVMAIVLGVVGGLGLMGTMSLNILERTREIGLMRAIGATSGAIRQIVVVEGVLIGIFSWGLGALLAFPLSKRLSDAVGMAMLQVPLSYTFSAAGVVLWLAIVVVLATAASALPAWNASRLAVSDILAYE